MPRTVVSVLAAVPLVALTGCSASGTDVPSADEVIEMLDYFEDTYPQDETVHLVSPKVGVGNDALPTFRASEGYTVALRCLSDEIPQATVADPEATAAANGENGVALPRDVETDLEGPCEQGSWVSGQPSTGGPVDVTITAGPETYWVAAVVEDDGTVVDEPAG